MPGSIIGYIKNSKCGWDSKILGKSTSFDRGHSHKELMKCLYRSNSEVFKLMQTKDRLEQEVKALQEQLAHYIIKEQQEKEKTGIMDVKEPIDLSGIIDAPPLNIGKDKALNDQQLAKNLLEAESIIGESLGTHS